MNKTNLPLASLCVFWAYFIVLDFLCHDCFYLHKTKSYGSELFIVSYHGELITGELPNLEISIFGMQNIEISRFDMPNIEISIFCMQNTEY